MSEENPYAAPATEAQVQPLDSRIPGPHNYATLGDRFLGKLIDGLIMLPVSIALTFLLGLVFAREVVANPGFMDILSGNAGFGIGVGLLLTVLGIGIYIAIQWTFWKATSQSIGKKVMKTQIVNLDGTPADVNTIAFQRYGIIAFLSALPFVGIIALIDVLFIFRADRNCLHDDIAKTRVIKLPPPTH